MLKQRIVPQIEFKIKFFDCYVFDIKYEDRCIGAIEMYEYPEYLYMEHIFVDKEYRGCGILSEVVKEFNKKPLKCLPLEKYRSKFEHLGFTVCDTDGTDIYYIHNPEIKDTQNL